MPLSRKNYLKKSNRMIESNDVKKKDDDVFDKLLSSPLKQDVHFQPLSFWKNKIQTYRVRKKTKKNPCWLYESSESDDSSYKSPVGFDSEPSGTFSESESSGNLTILENPLQLQAKNLCVIDVNIDNSSTSTAVDVKLVTSKINEMKLSNATVSKSLSDSEISQASEEDLTNKNLMETFLLLDSRLVTKRRKYNFSNSSVRPRTSPSHSDHANWVYPKSLTREFQYSDISFISDSKVFASTSQCHSEKGMSRLIRNRHVAIRKRHESTRSFSEANTESQESFECSRISTSSSLDLIDICSAVSTDVDYQRQTSKSEDSLLEDSRSCLDTNLTLEPDKNFKSSMSIPELCGNKSVSEVGFQNSKTKGNKFKDFVKSVLEIPNETLYDLSISNISVTFDSSAESFTFESRTRERENSLINSEFSESVYDESYLEKTFLNRTVKVTQPEGTPSAFRTALGLEQPQSFVEDTLVGEATQVANSSSISARDFILAFCNQEDVLSFEEHFNERMLKDCKKVGEGVYGEVFMCSDTVIKIIPIEGTELVNEERQKTFEEIISEVVIASKLSNLRNGEKHRTSAFSEMKRCWCVRGKYPQYLLKLWEEYNKTGHSDNDSPVMFKEDQIYIILELSNGGQDLESFVFKSSRQSLSIFIQTAFGLAVAEKACEFEHRDLHWGNVLVSKTNEKFLSATLDGVNYEIPSRGVKVCIIDFTLSRISHEGCSVYNNLSVDPTLFAGEGDYQFDIYRMMLQEVKNDWSLFRPRNNLFWLHYLLDKMITMVRYKNKKGKIHAKHDKDLKFLESVVLKCNDSAECVTSDYIKNLINNE